MKDSNRRKQTLNCMNVYYFKLPVRSLMVILTKCFLHLYYSSLTMLLHVYNTTPIHIHQYCTKSMLGLKTLCYLFYICDIYNINIQFGLYTRYIFLSSLNVYLRFSFPARNVTQSFLHRINSASTPKHFATPKILQNMFGQM